MNRVSQRKAIAFDGIHESLFTTKGNEEDTARRAFILRSAWSLTGPSLELLKKSIVGRLIPLNKVAPELPSIDDYRPIVALSPLAKFLEARFLPKLQNYVKNECLPSQTGFVLQCGTFINLQRIIRWGADNRRDKGFLIFIDLRKAFDSVPHITLFNILRDKNVLAPEEIQFLKAWYSHLRVGIPTDNGIKYVRCTRGVPQGSLLSPLLFDIFFDTLLRALTDAGFTRESLFAYADDLAIGTKYLFQIHRAINVIERWGQLHNTPVNKRKCGIMQLASRSNSRRFLTAVPRTNVRGYPVVDTYKYLGVWIDYRLHLYDHLKHIKGKTEKIHRSLRRLCKNKFSPQTWLNLWKCYILPHFLYTAVATETRREHVRESSKRLEKMVRISFKKFMGLKKNTRDELVTLVSGFNFEEFSRRITSLAEARWRARLNPQDPPEPQQERLPISTNLKNITWKIIDCWNSTGGYCPSHPGSRASIQHLKEMHGVTNHTLRILSPAYLMRRGGGKRLPESARVQVSAAAQRYLLIIQDPHALDAMLM